MVRKATCTHKNKKNGKGVEEGNVLASRQIGARTVSLQSCQSSESQWWGIVWRAWGELFDLELLTLVQILALSAELAIISTTSVELINAILAKFCYLPLCGLCFRAVLRLVFPLYLLLSPPPLLLLLKFLLPLLTTILEIFSTASCSRSWI